jgi:hypothetical protein
VCLAPFDLPCVARPDRTKTPKQFAIYHVIVGVLVGAACAWGLAQHALAANETPTTTGLTASPALDEVVVTAERLRLIGLATTASEGVVVNNELALTPAYRPGQLLETVPGLVATIHSD